MSEKIPFKSIEGSSVKEEGIFKDFVEEETLIEYDSPLLIKARAPDGSHWLFDWCDNGDEGSAVSRWIAIKVSQPRLEAILRNHISLRQALTLPEDKFYVLDAKNIFEPLRVKLTHPENLIKDYYPADDLSLTGEPLNPSLKQNKRLRLNFHILTEDTDDGKIPIPIMAPLQIGFQHYFTEVAHIFNRLSSKDTRVPARTVPTAREWTAINIIATHAGSFRMECEASGMSQETEKLSKACEILEKIMTAKSEDMGAIKDSIGNEGLISASTLAQCVANLDISFSIRWSSPENPNGYIVLDKRRAQNFLNLVKKFDAELPKARNITITLTEEEADLIRKDVNGRGGHQSLLRGLQKKLKKDNSLELTPAEIERVLRYGMNYGGGGFQGRLAGIAMALKRVGTTIQTS